MAHSSGGRLGGRPVGGWTSHRKNAPFLYFHTTGDTTEAAGGSPLASSGERDDGNRTPLPLLSPYYSDLLALADALVAEGRYELTVVVAQMACEVVVEQTLTPLLKGKN